MEGMKSYGWGIVERDGIANVNAFQSEEQAESHAEWLRVEFPKHSPFRTVELFYKEQP